MAKGPAISVVLPFFNAEQTLSPAIESVLGQTLSDFELILVDNNSKDRSPEIAQKFSSDRRVSLTRETKQGVAWASNFGYHLAKAPLIARMDADDVMVPNRLEKQLAFMQAYPKIGLVGGRVKYLGDEANQGFVHYVNWSNKLVSPKEIELNRFVELPVVNPTFMFRKSLLLRHGGYKDGDFPEDYEMLLRWMDKGVQVGKLTDVILEWSDLKGRLTRTDPRYSEEAFFRIKAQYLAKWLEQNVPGREIWIWGAGKLSRRRSDFLHRYGISINGYIDVRNRALSLPCIHFEDIPKPGHIFILSYVSNRGKREEVRQFLIDQGYQEGKDFLLAA